MLIIGKMVALRAIEREDLRVLQQWANDPEMCAMLGSWHFPTSMNDTNKWFESLGVNSMHQRFAITLPGNKMIGTANVIDINWKDRNAQHGLLIGDLENRGKGYAIDTIMAVMKYCFEELGMNRLDTTIIEYNQTSYNLYVNKCGWHEEGRQKNWYFRQNKYWDKFIIGITKDQYMESSIRKNYWDGR